MNNSRIAAAALAALGAASAIPIPLAQLDFAGLFNVFNIDAGDSPDALQVMAGVGGVLTIGPRHAFVGAALALTDPRTARTILAAAALAGFMTALPLWMPAGVVGAAAVILGNASDREPEAAGVPACRHAASGCRF